MAGSPFLFGLGGSATTTLTYNQTAQTVSGLVSNPLGSSAGLVVAIIIDGQVQAAATTASDGTWSTSVASLSAGAHAIAAMPFAAALSFTVPVPAGSYFSTQIIPLVA